MSENEQSQSDTGRGQCTVHRCKADATRTLEWPEPGGFRAGFCDDHAEQKVAIAKVEEVDSSPVSPDT